MKKSNIVLVVLLVVLVAVSWIAQISNGVSSANSFNQFVSLAKDYEKEGLFQKAIENLNSAFSVKEDEETRTYWLDLYELAYNDGVVTAANYADALMQMCEMHEGDPQYWEQLMQLHIDREDLNRAYEVLQEFQKTGISSELVTELGDKAKYAIRTTKKAYMEVRVGDNGYYTVKDTEGWGVLDAEGEAIIDCDHKYIGPYNNAGISLRENEKGIRLISDDNVVEAIVSLSYIRTGIYSDGIIPVCVEEKTWRYYDCAQGDFILDTYDLASNFSDDVAAVCKNGKWSLINKDGKAISDITFDDIKLHSNGNYEKDEIMIASVDGQYNIYDAKGSLKSELKCADMDVYMDGYIAYKDSSGKWGYVNTKGETKIEPQFENAKSFSGGLGAVCVDGLWGFAKQNGKVVIDCQYLDGGYFSENGICFVSVYEGKYHKIELRY